MNSGKKLIVASNNKHKLIEINEILGARFSCVLSLFEAGIDVEIEETGATFVENALIKAREVFSILHNRGERGFAVISDDSGLEVDALGGAPGVISARYSGEGDEGNNVKLLRELSNQANRRANYTAVVAFKDEERELIGEGKCYGEILHEYRGTGGFGYDPLFLSFDLNKTFAECSLSEKNSISHRKRAVENLLTKLS